MTDDPDFETWVRMVPLDLTNDPIWRTPAYRLSLYVMSQAQGDAHTILRHRLTRAHADQLLRSVGAISANLDEGYSRSSGRERAHFYEYALGSAREARSWYYKCAVAFTPDVLAARLACLSRIVRILTAVVPRERAAKGITRRKPIPSL